MISERPPFRLNQDHPRIRFCESTPVEFPLFNSPDHTLPLATRIAEVCKHHDIDVIHAHYAIPHAAAAWIARELIAVQAPPIVTTLHGTDIVYLGGGHSERFAETLSANSCLVAELRRHVQTSLMRA